MSKPMISTNRVPWVMLLACSSVVCALHVAWAVPGEAPATAAQHDQPDASAAKARLDRSGRKRIGKASLYAGDFSGKKMADGTRMRPHADNAASKTLPLGTTAKVTNLETGQSAVVTIRDRGPYVKGRIVDLSPATAQQIGMTQKQGVARVEVTPIAVAPAAQR